MNKYTIWQIIHDTLISAINKSLVDLAGVEDRINILLFLKPLFTK